MEIRYQAKSEYSEKQIQYYRKTNPYRMGIQILKWFCYIIGGASVVFNMIFFMTASFSEMSILNIIWFLAGMFLLVDGAAGSPWIDKVYQKRIQKQQKDGEIVVSFFETEVQATYETYKRTELFSYEEIEKIIQDFEGYYLFMKKDIFYVKRKKFDIGDGYEFPRFIEQKSKIKVEK